MSNYMIVTIVVIVTLLAINYSNGNDDASNWGGWNVADNKVETAYLFRTFYAYFDERSRSSQLDTNTLSKLGSLVDDDKHLYVVVRFTGLPEHLPSFFDNWKDKFMEHMRNAQCIYYCHGKNQLPSKKPHTETVPVIYANGSRYDWSWYPSTFSIPYVLYCPLPSNILSFIPYAVTISPPRLDDKVALGLELNYTSYTHIIYGRNLLKDIITKNNNDSKDIIQGSSYDIDINHNITTIDNYVLCVSPESGNDYTSGLYDDMNLLTSFINYYHSMGINNMYFYDNKIDTIDTTTPFIKTIVVARNNGMNINLIPDEEIHHSQYTHYNNDINLGSNAYIHPSLFSDICIRRNIKVYKYVILLQYTDFIVSQKNMKLSHHLDELIKNNPMKHGFLFNTIKYLRDNDDSINICLKKYDNSYGPIFCTNPSTNDLVQGDSRIMASPENVLDSSYLHAYLSDDSNIIQVDPTDVIVHQYKTTNYDKSNSNSNSDSNSNSNIRSSDTTNMLSKYSSELLHTKIINTSLADVTNDYMMKNRTNNSIPRLLLFSSIRGDTKNDHNFRKIQIALNSWLELTLHHQTNAVVRVLLLTDIRVNEDSMKRLLVFDHLKKSKENLIIRAATQCSHPLYGIPTVDCLFRTAIILSHPSEYIMFSNSDIVYFNDLIHTFISACNSIEFKNKFIMIGRRYLVHDEEFDETIDNKVIISKLYHLYNSSSSSDSEFCLDYFLIPPESFYKLFPPFLIGRASWDNIMTFWLFNQTLGPNPVPLIEVTNSVLAAHLGWPSSDFDSRTGSQWSIKLLTVWERREIGKTTSTQYISSKSCTDSTTCEYSFQRRDPQPNYDPQIWQYKANN